MEFKALGETLPVYDGSIRTKGTVLISRRLKPGEHKLVGKLKCQECRRHQLQIPQQTALNIPIKVEAMVPRRDEVIIRGRLSRAEEIQVAARRVSSLALSSVEAREILGMRRRITGQDGADEFAIVSRIVLRFETRVPIDY